MRTNFYDSQFPLISSFGWASRSHDRGAGFPHHLYAGQQSQRLRPDRGQQLERVRVRRLHGLLDGAQRDHRHWLQSAHPERPDICGRVLPARQNAPRGEDSSEAVPTARWSSAVVRFHKARALPFGANGQCDRRRREPRHGRSHGEIPPHLLKHHANWRHEEQLASTVDEGADGEQHGLQAEGRARHDSDQESTTAPATAAPTAAATDFRPFRDVIQQHHDAAQAECTYSDELRPQRVHDDRNAAQKQ